MAKHIDLAERRAIERGLTSNKGVNEIARLRRRAKSTISEEIRLGSKDGIYRAVYAHTQAQKSSQRSKTEVSQSGDEC